MELVMGSVISFFIILGLYPRSIFRRLSRLTSRLLLLSALQHLKAEPPSHADRRCYLHLYNMAILLPHPSLSCSPWIYRRTSRIFIFLKRKC